MKRASLVSILIQILSGAAIYSQSFSTSLFRFCKQMGETITIAELDKCPKLSPKNKNVEVKSFTVDIFVKSNTEMPENISEFGKDGLFLEYKIKGDTLSEEVFEYFRKAGNSHLKIVIDDIVAIENGKEGKYPGFTFYLHNK